jgi:PKD repeat protein
VPHNHTRRSILGALAATGLLDTTAVTVDGAAAVATNQFAQNETTDDTPSEAVSGVEVIDWETGRRAVYRDWADIDRTELPAGRYDVTELRESPTGIEAGRSLGTISVGDVGMQEESEIRLGVLIETGRAYGHVPTDGTVAVQVGAVEQVSGVAREPAAAVDVEVELADPDGSPIETQTATTSDSGNASLTFGLDDAAPGKYTVAVRSDNAEPVTFDRLRVGPYTAMPYHSTAMTVGEQTTLGVFSAVGGTPEENVTRELVVRGPGGSQETIDVDIGTGGIGLVQFTPSQPGPHEFDGVVSPAPDETIQASGETKAFALRTLRGQYFDGGQETMRWGALVADDGGPVSNSDFDVQVLERRFGEPDEVVAEFTTTTNGQGMFDIEFEKPDEGFSDYRVEIQTTAGEAVFLDNDSIFFSSVPDSDPEGLRLSLGSREVAPGQSVAVEGELVADGSPVAGATVSLLLAYDGREAGRGEIPVETSTAQTDADGTLSTTIEIPADAPDGENIGLLGSAEVGGELREARGFAEIRQYEVTLDDPFRFTRGETNTIDVSVTDRRTDDPISGVDLALFGNRDHLDVETFDTGHTTTDANGQGTIDLAIPSDATNRVSTLDFGPYRGASSAFSGRLESFDIAVDASPDPVSPDGTVTVSYTTDIDESTAAFVAFPQFPSPDLALVQEGEDAMFDIPGYADDRGFLTAQLFVVAANGDVAVTGHAFSLESGLSAGFQFSPAEPQPGQSVEFEDTSSSGPETTIESYEWAFGDGSTATGQQATHTYDSTGEYTVTLTVTTAAGDSDTATKTVSVTETGGGPPAVVGGDPPSDLDDDGLYEDIDGDGEFTVGDVQDLFENRNASVVQDNAEFFNFSGNDPDEVTIEDVEALFMLLEKKS